MQQHKCTMPTAMHVIGEVLMELKSVIPVAEIRQVPLSQVMQLPPELLAR